MSTPGTPVSCGNSLVTGSGAQLVIDFPPFDLSVSWPDNEVSSPLDIRSFNEWSYDLPDVPDSDLLTKHYEAVLPGDLIRLDAIEMEIRFSSEVVANRVDDRPQGSDQFLTGPEGTVPIGQQGYVIIYFPGTAPATGTPIANRWYLAGAGYLRRWTMPNMQNNQRNVARAQVLFNNKGPTSGSYPGDQRPRWYQIPAPP